MTREELLALVKGLQWERKPVNGPLRCANGDCPILAAYRLRYPNDPDAILQSRYSSQNAYWTVAIRRLELPYDVANQLVQDADNPIVHTGRGIPELEGR